MAVEQSLENRLNHLYRGQAPSHIFLCLTMTLQAALNCRHKKNPLLRAGFFRLSQYKLDNLNFFSLHAFLTAGSDERNLLAFFQAFEAVGLDSFEVNEQVVTGLWSDEAEAFFIVEPLNGTSLAIRHGVTP